MYKFDTKVQHLKYKVLRTVAKHAWEGDLAESILDIPKEIIPGKVPTMRCCVYKERAILAERIKLATGGNRKNPNVIEALDIACDDCPSGGYVITDNCRGCIAHRCEDACPKGAITHDEHHHAHIDKERCINCGRCAEACPYSAILNRRRPCQNACKIGAITMNEDGTVKIDDSKCISCGACVYRCPFGALSDKSFILDAIKLLKEEKHVYAIVAPAIASQFAYAKLGQVVTGIKQLGFYEVVEAALGADMVAYAEAKELAEKGFLTSSCCPAFVSYVHKQFPMLSENVSHNMSPMATIAKFIKGMDKEAKTIFIGPCTAKKGEAQLHGVREYVDCVMTFEELQAVLDSREIELTELEETDLNNASGFGRSFARCGGLAEAAVEALKEQGIDVLYPDEQKRYYAKAPAFSFSKLRGLDAYLSPEMKSTGEAIGYDNNLTHALYKAMQASGMKLENYGTVFVTISDEDKEEALPLIRRFYQLGFNIEATVGTAVFLRQHGIKTRVRAKVDDGSDEILNSIRQGYVTYVINTMDVRCEDVHSGSSQIRRCAVENGVTMLTALDTVRVLLDVLEEITLGISTIDA